MAEVSRSPGPAPAVTPTPARTVSSSPGAGAAVRGRRSASGGAGSSEGERLPEATRAALEQGLGADLSAVRVRRDSRSQEVAKRLSARAFAYGPTIVLGPNERPDDLPLMAHEAAHVVQQGAAPRLQAYSSSGGDSLEHEARAASSAVSSGQSYQVQGTSAPRVQRLGLSDILDYFADKANNIPGFRMFTVIIGVNPINGASVERSGANIIRAIIEFLPGGKLITDALENNGVLAKVGAWVEGQFKTLGMVGSAFKNALSEFIDSLGWRDIFHLGDVWTRAKRIFTDPIDRLIDFGKGLLVGIIRFVKEAVLRPLGKLAEGTRGYDLLKAVLGSDPVTGDTVPQTAETLIGGFMKLINQEEIWNNIKKSNAIPRAWAWFKKALKGLWALVSSFPQRVIDGFKSLELFDIVLVPRAFVKIGKVFLGFLADFIGWAGGTIWDLLKIIFAVVAPEVMPYLSKVEASFKTILKDPIRFVKNLVAAGKLGFNQFRDKIGTHLKNSLIDWLTGSLPGVYIPKALEIKEILLFVLSVLGISWANIRAKLVNQFGEPLVQGLETGFTVVKKLVTEGPAAAWDEIKSELGNLKEQAMGAITTYVVETVVKKAAAKLVSMLIPGAAFIQAILTTYDTVMVFVDKLSKIVQVVKAFLDSIMAIAAGQLGAAANKVESTLAGLLTLAISFLAGFAGLGRIADKIMGLLKEKVWTPIDKALDKGVAAIGNAGKAFLAKLTGKKNNTGQSGDPEHDRKLAAGLAEIDAQEDRLQVGGKLDKTDAETIAVSVKGRHPIFKRIDVRDGGGSWDFHYVASDGTKKGMAKFGKDIFKKSMLPTLQADLKKISSPTQVGNSMVQLETNYPGTLERYKNNTTFSYSVYIKTLKTGDKFDLPGTYLNRRASTKVGKRGENKWISKRYPGKSEERFKVFQSRTAFNIVIPDILTGAVVGDAKDTKKLSFTPQLHDFFAVAKPMRKEHLDRVFTTDDIPMKKTRNFVLIVRNNTHSDGETQVSGPLLAAADAVHRDITDKDVKL